MKFGNYSLHALGMQHLAAYYTLVENNRERIATYFPVTLRETGTLEDTERHICQRMERAAKKEYMTYVISDNANAGLAGVIFLKDIDWNIPKAELGFYIDRKYEGRGITTLAVKELVRYCFNELGMKKVFMRVAQDNVGSRKVAEKNGFMAEGLLRKDFKTSKGQLIDVVYYGLICPDTP